MSLSPFRPLTAQVGGEGVEGEGGRKREGVVLFPSYSSVSRCLRNALLDPVYRTLDLGLRMPSEMRRSTRGTREERKGEIASFSAKVVVRFDFKRFEKHSVATTSRARPRERPRKSQGLDG